MDEYTYTVEASKDATSVSIDPAIVYQTDSFIDACCYASNLAKQYAETLPTEWEIYLWFMRDTSNQRIELAFSDTDC